MALQARPGQVPNPGSNTCRYRTHTIHPLWGVYLCIGFPERYKHDNRGAFSSMFSVMKNTWTFQIRQLGNV